MTTISAMPAWSLPPTLARMARGLHARTLGLADQAMTARYGPPPPPREEAGPEVDEETRLMVALICAAHF